jgi:hypothetical protein
MPEKMEKEGGQCRLWLFIPSYFNALSTLVFLIYNDTNSGLGKCLLHQCEQSTYFKAVLRIRIRIRIHVFWASWIRIRIH